MDYESLVEIGNGIMDLVRIQTQGTAEERDLLTALRGFQMHSQVTVSCQSMAASRRRILFASWQSQAIDRYDWDYSEHLTVPNPDFQSSSPDAVCPQDRTLTVYHSNARRIELAQLAAPFNVASDFWAVTDPQVAGPAEVDLSRSL
ncbi:hypothetical protein [Sphaerotilus microaerophilus]|uniref:Uncharacterized protein n=1 Tax=Sphaerotilus microaerophilus TaxID=2914710 RepID=A0ABM7YKG2_9BURK|nr:hypothetical protein [Sphaerotilus sp. FB-5]BDI04842.1 hypothetical protein CATMQ487_18120 [Sphaerotilus sp. FB-5]